MKKTLLLLLLFFGAQFSITAQDISVNPDPVMLEIDKTVVDQKVDFMVVNNANRDIDVYWEFEPIDAPDDWTFYLCDLNVCYTPAIISCPCNKPNFLAANSSNVFMMHIQPNEVTGTGSVMLKILEACDDGSTSLLEIPITYVVSETSSTSFQDLNNDISIYPNPSSQMISIKEDKEVTDIIIYNLIGKKIKSVSHSEGQSHDITDLERGIYLVRMLNEEQNILKVSRLTKR